MSEPGKPPGGPLTRSPRSHPVLSGLAWIGAAIGAVLTGCHAVLGDGVMVVSWFHAATAWWPLAILPFLLLSLALRRLDIAAVCGLTVLGWLWFDRPPLGADTPGAGPRVRLVSGNQLMVNAHLDTWLDEVLAAEPDVLVVQELTPDLTARLAGRFPHAIERPQWHSFGGGIYSRFPIVGQRVLQVGGVEVIQATLGTEPALTVWNVHTLPPFSAESHRDWLVQTEAIAKLAAREQGPLVIAGDFNLTRHHQGYRSLTSAVDDAYRRCGRWVAWTWPNPGLFPLPFPPIKLDHVFVRGPLQCVEVEELPGTGSDHRPIVLDVALGG